MINIAKRTLAVAFTVVLSATLALPGVALAEGSHQMNEFQTLEGRSVIYADILNAGETLNISLCEDTTITIYDIQGTPQDLEDDTQVDSAEFTANLNCDDPLPGTITSGMFKFTPENIGTYRVDLGDNDFDRYDLTVTSNNAQNPITTNNNGRVWSYLWYFYAQEVDSPNEYPEESSTDADLYALVPAPANGQNFVWKLDLNNFAGGSYRLLANNIGLNAPYSGVSADQSDSTVTPMYPIYLGYPEVAGNANTTTPTISAQTFAADNLNKKGTFQFNSNSDNATYAITVDTNKDGVYGTGDRLLLGEANTGLNTVEWDGKYANGETVSNGNYNARIQLRIGEFHFVARDVEASGGTHDGGETWANGLTIYKALDGNTTENTTVFWDDITALRYEDDNEEMVPFAEATSNLPNGATSGSTADVNNDGKPDGFHTWGDFEGDGMGDGNFIDTFTYGADDTEILPITVSWNGDTDVDGVGNEVENGALNNGDGNGDGTADSQQVNVTSLVNPVTGAYSTIAIDGCESLSNVGIFAENSLQQKDGSYDYPLGLFDFDAICTTPGSTATVTMFYDKVYNTSDWSGRKFVNGVYGVIPNVTFSTADIGGTEVTTMSYEVTDGGELDEDGLANGTIVDPAGPAITAAASLSGTTSPLTSIGAPNSGFLRASSSAFATALTVGSTVVLIALIALIIRKRYYAQSNR